MRRFPLLLALLLLAALGLSTSAQAAPLPAPGGLAPVLSLIGEEEDEAEAAEGGEEIEAEDEACEPEEGEPCEEELEGAEGPDDRCLLEKASAAVTANPGKRRLRLSVHYKALKPATVAVEASLRGSKGVLYLGNDHARFRRAGIYRETFALPEKKMKKALAARDFEVELQVVNTPPSCRVALTAHRDGGRKLSWS